MATKLVVSIVQNDDAERLISALRDEGFSSTKVSTTGGFLRQGNATILAGTEEGDVHKVLGIIQRNCHAYTYPVTPLAGHGTEGALHPQHGGIPKGSRGRR